MIIDALSPLENSGDNSRTRLFYESDTQRLPEESNATPVGKQSRLCDMGKQELVAVKLDWPMTRDALSPLENGGENSRTRLFRSEERSVGKESRARRAASQYTIKWGGRVHEYVEENNWTI